MKGKQQLGNKKYVCWANIRMEEGTIIWQIDYNIIQEIYVCGFPWIWQLSGRLLYVILIELRSLFLDGFLSNLMKDFFSKNRSKRDLHDNSNFRRHGMLLSNSKISSFSNLWCLKQFLFFLITFCPERKSWKFSACRF